MRNRLIIREVMRELPIEYKAGGEIHHFAYLFHRPSSTGGYACALTGGPL